ncbi:MAG: hypothetical protein LBO80_07655 [Treponema sp.]|jgi:hypothetical protein|nr:hypothetical protein [Treponema sp.]
MGQTSSAAQIIISVIPIVGIVMGSLVVFFYLLWNYKWKKLLVQAGQYRDPKFDLLSFSLLAGLLLGSVGITLTIFLAITQGAGYALLGGLIPLSTGAGLLIFYGIKHGNRTS